MKYVLVIEQKINEIVHSPSLYQMPENARRSLAHALWWIVPILGVIQLLNARSLWHIGHTISGFSNWEELIQASHDVQSLSIFYYLAFGLLLATGILLLYAVPGLRAMNKPRGWNIVYYALILQIAYGILRVFADVGNGAGTFVLVAVSAVAATYALFQTRSYFAAAPPTDHIVGVEKPHTLKISKPTDKKVATKPKP